MCYLFCLAELAEMNGECRVEIFVLHLVSYWIIVSGTEVDMALIVWKHGVLLSFTYTIAIRICRPKFCFLASEDVLPASLFAQQVFI